MISNIVNFTFKIGLLHQLTANLCILTIKDKIYFRFENFFKQIFKPSVGVIHAMISKSYFNCSIIKNQTYQLLELSEY